jgi:hypothetical protein
VVLGDPGPQPSAANMREFVSNIFLALRRGADNYSNTQASTASGAQKPEFFTIY